MKLKHSEIETSVKSKLNQIFSTPKHPHCRKEPLFEFEDGCIEEEDEEEEEEEEEHDVSTQFLQTQKIPLVDSEDHLESNCSVFLVFVFNSAKNDIKLLKSYLMLFLVNERGNEPIVIKKAIQFVSFEFGDLQLLDLLSFFRGAKSLFSFLKAYKTSKAKWYFLYEWINDPEKLNNTQFPPYENLFSKLRNNFPLGKN